MSRGTKSRSMALAGSNSLRADRREGKTRGLPPTLRPEVKACELAPGAGPPTLNVDSSCEAAGMGSVVLGRDKKACLGDETTAQDTLRQNWSKYAAADKSECIGMVTTGGPASYVELLSCVEILRDARNIRNTDALEADDSAISSRRRRRK